MRLLISNDDGYQSQGLHSLVETLEDIAHITVVAPEWDRSGASNSLTLDRPLKLQKSANGTHYVNGTPTDCVHIGLTGLVDVEPDMVISGINHGANLGDDVLYSGTVAAAMEGRFLGLPAIAVSLAVNQQRNFISAAKIVRQLLTIIKSHPLPANTLLNINVPDLPLNLIKGIKTTRLGKRHPSSPAIATFDPKGQELFWVGLVGNAQDIAEDTDFYAVNKGYVSVTPLRTDLTDFQSMEKTDTWLGRLTL